jgi:hypothetical protein
MVAFPWSKEGGNGKKGGRINKVELERNGEAAGACERVCGERQEDVVQSEGLDEVVVIQARIVAGWVSNSGAGGGEENCCSRLREGRRLQLTA